MIYVFYSNDPLHNDQGGGVEHLRGIYRALVKSDLNYHFVVSRLGESRKNGSISYISSGANFLKYYAYLWRWFLMNRKHFRDGDVFHFHRNYAAWPKYFLASRSGKTIITYHGQTGFVIKSVIGILARPIRAIMKMVEKKSISLADIIIFVSDRDRQAMRESMLGKNYDKTLVIPAAFDGAIFGNTFPPSVECSNKILMVGRIAEIKNIPLAIDALTLLHRRGIKMEFLIAGDGDDRGQVEAYAARSPCVDSIKFLGRVEHSDIPEYMKSSGMVLLTSFSEASPTVVKEAILASRPIVTTDVGDVRLWVKPGLNGFICDSTPESVADGLENAREMVKKMEYNQAVDLSVLSEDNIMDQLLSVYRKCELSMSNGHAHEK